MNTIMEFKATFQYHLEAIENLKKLYNYRN